MPTLAQIVNDHATVTYGEGEGASLTIAYRPQRASALPVLKFLRELQGWDQASAGLDEVIEVAERVAHVLSELITAWDALEADGVTVVPLTPERLEHEGLGSLLPLFGAIMADARRSLGEQNGTRSQTTTPGTPGKAKTSSRRGVSR